MNEDRTSRWWLALAVPLTVIVLLGLWLLQLRSAAEASPAAPNPVVPVLQFSGVTDDGKKGAPDRKEATSILCTNAGTTNATIEIELYQWSGALVYTGTVTAAPKQSYTFSTQNTTIYFDDVIFGTGGGTDSIFQGYGRVLSDRSTIRCTAQVLDPLGYPPVYMDKLTMYHPDGTLIGDDWEQFLPTLMRR